jgi:hypothetical protein
MLRAPSQAESFELISLIFFYCRGLDVVSRRRKPLMPPLVLLPSLFALSLALSSWEFSSHSPSLS